MGEFKAWLVGYKHTQQGNTRTITRPTGAVIAIAHMGDEPGEEITYPPVNRTETDWKAIEHYFADLF